MNSKSTRRSTSKLTRRTSKTRRSTRRSTSKTRRSTSKTRRSTSKTRRSTRRSTSKSTRCQKSAIRTNPKLWELIKSQVLNDSKGGVSGKWSARKAQIAVAKYKSRGGSYKGNKSKCNSLTKWSKEDWGYVGKQGQSRYLPHIVRSHLSPSEKRIENRKKGSRKGRWISYSSSVDKKMRKYGIY
jgi:hypothetical protein